MARFILHFVLLAAFIGFTVNVDAACATTAAVAHVASDCDDMTGMAHGQPKPDPTKQRAANCPLACVALAQSDTNAPTIVLQTSDSVRPTLAAEMGGMVGRPPVPPPRGCRWYDVNTFKSRRMT